MQRVLVTGATGFTGSHLVRQLVEQGAQVRVIARNAERARTELPAGVDVVHGDIADASVTAAAVKGQEIVYHLAAAFREAGIPDSRYYEVHVDATRNLLDASRAEGIRRFVHCSTVGVHSHVEGPPADENAPFNPDDVYQRSKAEGELLASRFQQEHAFPLTVIRPAPIYGPGDMRLRKLFAAVARRRFAMIGSGEVQFHMIHVDDLARGMRIAADKDEAIGEAFILAGDESVSLNELVRRIAEIYDVPVSRLRIPAMPVFVAAAICEAICVPLRIEPPLYRRRVAFFTKSRSFDTTKARRLLGFEPRITLQQGLRETAEWYRDKGLL